MITDENGEVISRRDFMPFGEELYAGVGPRTEALKYGGAQIDNIRQRFTGYEKDWETQLDFAEARMYQNKHGRFTAPDPLLASTSLTDPQSFNRFVYVGNNPVNFTDPSGLCKKNGVEIGPCPNYSGQVYVAPDGTYQNTPDDGAKPYNGPPITVTDNGVTLVIVGGPNGGWTRQEATQAPVTQGENVAASTGNVAGQNAADAAASGASSLAPGGGTVSSNVTHRQIDDLPPCPEAVCGSVSRSLPILDLSKAPGLKTVEAIKLGAQAIQFIPGLNVAGTAIEFFINVGQGNGRDAASGLPNLVPGLKLLRKADKAVDVGRSVTPLLNAAPARLTQGGLEHIVSRHWATSGAKNAGLFSPGTTARDFEESD